MKVNKLFVATSSFFFMVALASCSLPQSIGYNVSHSLGASAPQSAPSIANVKRKTGTPYAIKNEHGVPIWYTPMKSSSNYREYGVASWYGKDFHAKKTANGDDYNMYAYTAAHKTLPLPTYVRVTNTQNGKSIVVKVNDRGPFYKERLIDMSYAGAKALGFDKQGTAPVLVEAISIYGGDVRRGVDRNKIIAANRAEKYPQNNNYKLTASRYQYKPEINTNHASSFTSRIANRDRQYNPDPYNNLKNNIKISNSISSKYFIQLGSFSNINNATKLYQQAKHIPGIEIMSININGQKYYRVIIEKINDLGTAQEKLELVKSNGFYNSIIANNK